MFVTCDMTVLVATGTNVVKVADGRRVNMWSQRQKGHNRGLGTRPTGYGIGYNKYRALVTTRAGANCARKAARLQRTAKQGVHVVSIGQDAQRG